MAETLILPGFEDYVSEPELLPEADATRIANLRQRLDDQIRTDRRETKRVYALKQSARLDERLSLKRLEDPDAVINTSLGFIRRKPASLRVVDSQTVLSWTSRGERQQITGKSVEAVVNEFLHISNQ